LYFAPPLLSFCANSPDIQPHHFQTVTDIRVGAAPVGEALLKKFKKKGPHLKFKEGTILNVLSSLFKSFFALISGYGMSETSVTTSNGPSSDITGSCGLLVPNTEAKIKDLESGKSLGPNESGELLIRGPQV